MFHKILICSDGSEYAQNAALLGSEIARRFQSEVLGLHVFDLSIITAGDVGVCSIPVSQEAMDNMMKSQREAAERVITPIFEQLERPYRMLQELGNPVDSIVQVAQREQADLILVGHQGMTGLKELFLGSVSYSVLQHAHCPVLVERGPAKPFGRILLTSDASAGAERAASLAFALAQRFDACLTVLNIAEPSGWFAAEEPNPNPVEAAEEHIAAERGERAVEESIQAAAKATGVAYQLREERGHPGKTIVHYAKNGQFDLIVMGSRGLGGLESLLLGSVSNYVARHAHCSVLVAR